MFDWIPNPMDWLGGSDRGSIPQGPDRWKQSQTPSGPEPASMKERYQQRAYAQVGAKDKTDFDAMDPRQRNTRLTGAYADMYMSDTDTMKWAGMAAYASDLVGTGIAATDAAGAIPLFPGISMGDGITAAGVDNKKLNELLAKGNAGVYDDLMWQHMAMQEGGIEAMRKMQEEGANIPKEQMAGWETIAAGKAALEKAKASGDEAAIKAANETVWSGNNALLEYEQKVFLQKLVYDDSPEARALFDKISPGMISPIPGGTSFINHNDKNGGPTGSAADIGDKDQRWDWISKSMAPEYRNREENNHGQMMKDMRKFSANADTGLPGLPVNTEDPLDSPTPTMPDIPYLPMIGRGIANTAEKAWNFGKDVYNDPLGTGGKLVDGALDLGERAIGSIGSGLSTAGGWAKDAGSAIGSGISSVGSGIVSFFSDGRLKQEVQPIESALEVLLAL